MDNAYRIPKIEEFIKGFTFEIKNTYKFAVIDFNTKTNTQSEPYDVWTEQTLSKDWDFGFFSPFDLKVYLENEYIRVKDGK